MKEKLRFLGLDVHGESIAVAIAEPDGEVRSLGTIPNRAESIRKLIRKLGPAEKLRACYEAGPTGYVVYWQLAELGIQCEVVAPTLVPVKAGDRVKTDRRDAEKLARCYRSGDLTAVWVPDEGSQSGWYCQFLEEDLKTSLPRKFTFATSDKVVELAEKGRGLKDSADRRALEHGISMGRGGVFLNLTSEQYAKLKR
jgi:hypothetical protein